jgi:hypothetical protein
MTWWRNLGGLLTACVLALLVVAPMASASACQCDNRVAAGAATVSVAQGDTQHDNSPCDAACCQGGHCHHGGQLLDASIASLPAPAPVATRPAPTRAYALASRPTTGPDRPPRA